MALLSALGRLGEIAADQWGLVTRQQADSAGIGRSSLERLVASSVLIRVDRGVYRFAGSTPTLNEGLFAAWLQLAPHIPRWERTPEDGVVSHESAAMIYGVGDLPANRHEFTFSRRRQSRRSDVRIHVRPEGLETGVTKWDGVYVTRPARTASDLLADWKVPDDVGVIIADSIHAGYEHPGAFAEALAPVAAMYPWVRPGDGLECLHWLLVLSQANEKDLWMEQARAWVDRASSDSAVREPALVGP